MTHPVGLYAELDKHIWHPPAFLPPLFELTLFICAVVLVVTFIRDLRFARKLKRENPHWQRFYKWRHDNKWQGKRLIAFGGKLGAGKTHSALETGLDWAERRKKIIVTNMELDVQAIEWYAAKRRMWHVVRLCRTGQIFRHKTVTPEDVSHMIGYENAIIIFDECGVFASAKGTMGRDYKVFHELVKDLLMMRKANTDLIWVCQVFEHVASEIRGVTEVFWHCRSFNGQYKILSGFEPYGYELFMKAPTVRNWIRYAISNQVVKFDQDLHICYRTLERLDGKKVPDARDELQWTGEDSHTEADDTELVWMGERRGWERWPKLEVVRPPGRARAQHVIQPKQQGQVVDLEDRKFLKGTGQQGRQGRRKKNPGR